MKFTEKHFLYLYNENMVTYRLTSKTLCLAKDQR